MEQAVIILHGMGEKIPMTTQNSFVSSVWTKNKSLVDPERPDPNTGGGRQGNMSSAEPDERESSTELRRALRLLG